MKNKMYMYEDSRLFGVSYLFAIGIPSAISAGSSTQVSGEPQGVYSHDLYWTERRANKRAAKYFRRYYGVNWDIYETYYPQSKR
jgi:hypothetical protein